jgi:hypothetical protein
MSPKKNSRDPAIQSKLAVHKNMRGNASQFFVAGELCRRGYAAVVTMGNTPNTDVFCSNLAGTKFVHIQVKTFCPGKTNCMVGKKANEKFTKQFFWILCGLPEANSDDQLEYYVIPAAEMSANVELAHQTWLKQRGAGGKERNDNGVRIVGLGRRPRKDVWNVDEFSDRWDLIENALKE